MGSTDAPYDTMHLVLLNVVPHLWKLFSGQKLVKKNKDDAYIVPKSTVALVGRELRGERRTVPWAQERSLRSIDVHRKSFKAADWLHFVLRSGEVLLAGRIPREFHDLFMALCRACRLFFLPRGLSKENIKAADDDIKYFVANYYTKVYRGSIERRMCLSTIATLLDVVPLLRACGPAWVWWQFPMERNIGALGKLIRSHSRPHANLEANVIWRCKAELITSFGEKYLRKEWAEATGKHPEAPGLPRGSLKVPETVGPDCALLPPRTAAVILCGAELDSMQAVLVQERAEEVPPILLAMKYYRIHLASGTFVGSKPVGSHCDKHRRRNYLLRTASTERVRRQDGSVEERDVCTFGAALH